MVIYILKSEIDHDSGVEENMLQQVYKPHFVSRLSVGNAKAALPSSGGLWMSLLVQGVFSRGSIFSKTAL